MYLFFISHLDCMILIYLHFKLPKSLSKIPEKLIIRLSTYIYKNNESEWQWVKYLAFLCLVCLRYLCDIIMLFKRVLQTFPTYIMVVSVEQCNCFLETNNITSKRLYWWVTKTHHRECFQMARNRNIEKWLFNKFTS